MQDINNEANFMLDGDQFVIGRAAARVKALHVSAEAAEIGQATGEQLRVTNRNARAPDR